MSSSGSPEFGPEWSAGFRRGSEVELRAWLDFAIECCDAADRIALADFRQESPLEPSRTGRMSPAPIDRSNA
jgi:hypothetical protein